MRAYYALRAVRRLAPVRLSVGMEECSTGDARPSKIKQRPKPLPPTLDGLPMKPAALFALLVAFPMVAVGASPGEVYRLVWSDEFDEEGPPDPKNWSFERGFLRNNEAQWYQPENAECRDGLLVIEGRRESRPNPNHRAGSGDWRRSRPTIEYTSACLHTRGKQAWQYGRFEVRAKIVAHEGLWPAIWFLGVEGDWPSNGEIDLMEHQRGNLLANACWGTGQRWVAQWDSSRRPIKELGADWDKEFHIWRMDWDEDQIELAVDDRVLNRIDLSKTVNPTDRGPKNPFRQPHYVLLNLAIGGDAGGDPVETEFPSSFEVDYVRVYQKQ